MLSIKSMVDQFVFRIEIIQYHISITLMRCCEYNDFISLANFSETVDGMRANINRSLSYLAGWELNIQYNIDRT